MKSRIHSIPVPVAREIFLSPLSEPWVQEEKERRFFSSIRLKNGTYKTTHSHRLDDFNQLIEQFLPRSRPLKLMDVAISSGISTVEWMDSLDRSNIAHHMTGGDLSVHAFLFSLGRRFHVLTDDTGHPLQFDINGKAVARALGMRSLVRYLPTIAVLSCLVRTAIKAAQNNLSAGVEERRCGWLRCRRIVLVTPRLTCRSNLQLVQDDIIHNAAFSHRFDVIRAANILNKAYFDDETLRTMLRNLRSRLQPGGLLAVCRTEDGRNHGSILILDEERRFQTLAAIGAGSEIEGLALGLPALSSDWQSQVTEALRR
jgi:hypothetical protein